MIFNFHTFSNAFIWGEVGVVIDVFFLFLLKADRSIQRICQVTG